MPRVVLFHAHIHFNIRYKNRSLFGIDLSSAMAVEALDLQANDQVLDMCCAPGAKLCMIANRIEASGSATGVDCAAHRLATCRSLLKKYRVGSHVRLFEADGTTFAVPPPLAPKERQKKHTLHVNHRKPYWAPKMLRFDPQTSTALYDKVLVDAECTHDGSISHILKVIMVMVEVHVVTHTHSCFFVVVRKMGMGCI